MVRSMPRCLTIPYARQAADVGRSTAHNTDRHLDAPAANVDNPRPWLRRFGGVIRKAEPGKLSSRKDALTRAPFEATYAAACFAANVVPPPTGAGVETRNASGRSRSEKRTTTRVAGHSGPVDRFWRVNLTSLTRETVPPISNQASHPVGDDVPANSGEVAVRLSAQAATATIKRIGQREGSTLASIVTPEIGLTVAAHPRLFSEVSTADGCCALLGRLLFSAQLEDSRVVLLAESDDVRVMAPQQMSDIVGGAMPS